jgi:hypothetical protein
MPVNFRASAFVYENADAALMCGAPSNPCRCTLTVRFMGY